MATIQRNTKLTTVQQVVDYLLAKFYNELPKNPKAKPIEIFEKKEEDHGQRAGEDMLAYLIRLTEK